MGKVRFLSDNHFFHNRIISLCNRPFSSVEEMNAFMIKQWNSVVEPDDFVWHLGDICWGKGALLEPIMKELKGRKGLILGNHDERTPTYYRRMGFEEVHRGQVFLMEEGHRTLSLSHKPPSKTYCQMQYEPNSDIIYLHGHTHSNIQRVGNRINCSAEAWDYTPRTLEELLGAKEGGVEEPKSTIARIVFGIQGLIDRLV